MNNSELVFARLGQLFKPSQDQDWSQTHAQVPFVRVEKENLVAYFSTRGKADSTGSYRSSFGRVELKPQGSHFICDSSKATQVFEPGPVGSFDDTGVMGGSIVIEDEVEDVFYGGWTQRFTVPYDWSIGRAQRPIGAGRFVREFPGPVIGPTPTQPFLHASPTVFRHKNLYHMYYLSGLEWFTADSGRLESVYRLRHATSTDLKQWDRSDADLFDTIYQRESQTSSAIFLEDGEYHMLFSYRDSDAFRREDSRNYRIGHASSKDLYTWKRRAEIKFNPEGASSIGDEKMQGYPSIFSVNRVLYMLYCGDGFGREGFFLARLQTPFSGMVLTGPNL